MLFLVLMFVKVPDRAPLVRKLVDRLNDGGAVIVLDKVHPPPGWLGTVYRRLTLAGKVATRTPAEEIVAKELSLPGVQRPLDDFVLPSPGAHEFFRFGEFASWIIPKAKDSKYGY